MDCNVYPIPANRSLTIQTDKDIKEITLFDFNGKQINFVSSIGSNNHTISVSGLAAGVYFIKIVDIDQKIAIKKFVKQ